MHLHDKTIGHVAKLVQLAMITGTDIIDHLRMMKLSLGEDGMVHIDEEYESNHNLSINDMIKNISQEGQTDE